MVYLLGGILIISETQSFSTPKYSWRLLLTVSWVSISESGGQSNSGSKVLPIDSMHSMYYRSTTLKPVVTAMMQLTGLRPFMLNSIFNQPPKSVMKDSLMVEIQVQLATLTIRIY